MSNATTRPGQHGESDKMKQAGQHAGQAAQEAAQAVGQKAQDFAHTAGQKVQDAAHAAIAFLRAQRFVNADKIALYGYSRGAIVGAMVATQDPRLAAVVLGGGAYDFSSWYPTPLAGIDANLRREAGTSAEAFTARSALPLAGKIRAPVLLLHGALDERIPAAQARAFAERLAAAGVPVSLKIFPGAQHAIPLADQYREINPFLQALLR